MTREADAERGPHELHTPVLLREVVEVLAPGPGARVLDATWGRGGHGRALLSRLGPEGVLVAIDCDPEAVDSARALARQDPRVKPVRGHFDAMRTLAAEAGVPGPFDAILLDLGLSSPQLDDPARGFGFRHSGPLDMRMDPELGESAASWLERVDEQELARVLRAYGELEDAPRLARAILAARDRGELAGGLPGEGGAQALARVVEALSPPGSRSGRGKGRRAARGRSGGAVHHPATRVFQAIRIHVNDELGRLERALPEALELLAPGGRLAVISFHSLEDRIVKRFMRDESRGFRASPGGGRRLARLPERRPRLRILARNVRPGAEELRTNPRARSAVLRAGERLPESAPGGGP